MIVKVMLVVVLVVMRAYMHMNGERFFVFTVAYFGFLSSLEKDFVDKGSKPNNIKYIFFPIETNETLLKKKKLLVKYFLKTFNYFN